MVPFLVEDVSVYAIYVFVISICFFLTYGDMGFLGAAQKYCAEEVGRGDLESELKNVSFVITIKANDSFPYKIFAKTIENMMTFNQSIKRPYSGTLSYLLIVRYGCSRLCL